MGAAPRLRNATYSLTIIAAMILLTLCLGGTSPVRAWPTEASNQRPVARHVESYSITLRVVPTIHTLYDGGGYPGVKMLIAVPVFVVGWTAGVKSFQSLLWNMLYWKFREAAILELNSYSAVNRTWCITELMLG